MPPLHLLCQRRTPRSKPLAYSSNSHTSYVKNSTLNLKDLNMCTPSNQDISRKQTIRSKAQKPNAEMPDKLYTIENACLV